MPAHLGLPGGRAVHPRLPGLTWVYLEEELFTWVYLDSPGFTWAHLGLPGGRAIKQVCSGCVLLFDEQVNKFMIFVLLQSCLKGLSYDNVAYYVYSS